MINVFHDDFREFIQTLNKYNVEYLLVGGYAVILYGYHRTTGDLDIWINPSRENYQRMIEAFLDFGLPTSAITLDEFQSRDNDVFTFGSPPISIDVMTRVKGLEFEETYAQSTFYDMERFKVRLIHYNGLIRAKRASGRSKDINDIEHLEEE